MTTSSRMTYAFARCALAIKSPHLCGTLVDSDSRDGGLPVSRVFAKVHPQLDLPLNALYLTVILVVIFGCIFLGSSRYKLR
jgi:choline transport protein